MPKLDWKSYEELVKDIYEQLGSASGVKILGHGMSCKYKGKSGVEHQIDVLTSHSDGVHDYLTDIECKYWDQHINKDTVMKVESIVEDCNFSKGIVVSKLGFTPDAVQYAKHVGVGLVELREMTDEDWKGRIRKIEINIIAHYPELTQVHVELEDSAVKEGFLKGKMSGNAQLMFIQYPTGIKVSLAQFIEDDFFKELLQKEYKVPFSKSYTFEQGSTMTYLELGKTYGLKAIHLTGEMRSITQTDIIAGSNQIEYYMKCIFEDVEILLNTEGKIVKHVKHQLSV